MLINTRKDLDAAPADEHDRFMAQLSGTIHKWRWTNGEWEQYADTSTIERFDFAVTDFPDAPVPDMPEQSPEEKEAERTLARIAARRYEAETAGIVFNGIPLDTTRQSQALITGAALSATRNPNYTVRWKTQNGPVALDADGLGAAADAVRDHVQACFEREFELLDALAGGTFTDDMLETGWPE